MGRIFGRSKQKEQERPSNDGFGALADAYSDPKVIRKLRRQGHSPAEISEIAETSRYNSFLFTHPELIQNRDVRERVENDPVVKYYLTMLAEHAAGMQRNEHRPIWKRIFRRG